MCNAVQVDTCQSQTFREGVTFWDTPYVMIFWHSNDDMKFYMQKYDKRIFAVLCV